ncbi:MAG: hypothetical protein ACTSX1_09075 [Candidatus Heimdallarchaeaceae archaeon]
MKTEFEKLQYIRTKGIAIKDEDGKFIPNNNGENKRTRGIKKGVLIAFKVPEKGGKLCVGFSLCHPRDRFDYKKGIRSPGLGKEFATLKALKNADNVEYVICNSSGDRQISKSYVKIPKSIWPNLVKFIARCKKYYKDSEFPPWAERLVQRSEDFAGTKEA